MNKKEILKRRENNSLCISIIEKLVLKGWKRPEISSYILGLGKTTVTNRIAGYADFKYSDPEKLNKALEYDSVDDYINNEFEEG
jgi:hypothetical protein